jgi:hypothetical protein
MRGALAWVRRLSVAALALHAGAVVCGPEQNAEDRINEVRARPAPEVGKGNWVFVPIPVANPTVGNGLQLAALYLHPKRPGEESAPAATSGIAGMATDQGSRLLGAFHDGSLANDQYRISAFGGYGKFNLRFYGVGDRAPNFSDNPLPYIVEGALLQLRGEARLVDNDRWFAGATYQFVDSSFTLETQQLLPGLPNLAQHFRSAGLGPQVTYDSRDSNYYPRSGQQLRIGWLNYGPTWGGDFRFDKGDVFYNHYLPFGDTSVLGLRARYQAASKETPFLFLPTLDMRGFSRDRYRDARTVSFTSEWRQKFHPRWGYVAYAEAGRIAPTIRELQDARTIATLGAGLRWQVTAERDMHLGIDAAFSSDDRAVFIQIGERF